MTHPLHSLLHLISISIAIGLAYIALDRFRYAKTVEGLFLKAQEEVCKKSRAAKSQRDTTLTTIKRRIKEIGQGIGPKLLFGKGPKLFGSATVYGFDFQCMGVLLVIQYLLLLYVTINHQHDTSIIFWVILWFSCIATIIPLAFIFGGKWQVNKYTEEINTMLGDFSEEYQAKIDELQQKVEN